MANKQGFIKSMLSDSKSGEVSSKRVIGFIGFIALLLVMFINALFSKTVAPVPVLVNAIEYIVIAALFGTSVEKFANRQKQDSDSEQV
jgi:membrane glycosyltransferase